MGRKGGWYGESQRHSEARKKGSAGGGGGKPPTKPDTPDADNQTPSGSPNPRSPEAQDAEVLKALENTSRSFPVSRNELGTILSQPGGGMGPSFATSTELTATVHRLLESGQLKYDSVNGGLYIAGNRKKKDKPRGVGLR
jgi:hypothetical protein